MSDPREPIKLVEETPETVTLRRTDYDALLSALEDAEDRMAVLEHRFAKVGGGASELLTLQEADRLIAGENPVKFWREKRDLTQQALAGIAGISKSFLSEIENGKAASVDTLRKLAHELKVDLDDLVP